MAPLDIIASLLTLVNVWLVVRRSLWNYPFGLVAVALSAAVFWRERLYSDALLQCLFFVAQLYGWWNWARHRPAGGAVAVIWLRSLPRLAWAIGIVAATLAWGALMHRYTDAAFPWWDAANLILSLAAQVLMSLRFADNWVLWVIVDIGATGLYAAKGLWAFTLLYVLLTGLAGRGLFDWLRASRTEAGA